MPRPAVISPSAPGAEHHVAAERVAVAHQAVEQPAHGLQAGVRVRRHLHARVAADVVGPVVVDEAPGTTVRRCRCGSSRVTTVCGSVSRGLSGTRRPGSSSSVGPSAACASPHDDGLRPGVGGAHGRTVRAGPRRWRPAPLRQSTDPSGDEVPIVSGYRAGTRLAAAGAGLLAAGAGVAASSLVASLFTGVPSPIISVGNAAIDLAPPFLKDFAIETFGANDKAVLLTGIYTVVALVAAAAGRDRAAPTPTGAGGHRVARRAWRCWRRRTDRTSMAVAPVTRRARPWSRCWSAWSASPGCSRRSAVARRRSRTRRGCRRTPATTSAPTSTGASSSRRCSSPARPCRRGIGSQAARRHGRHRLAGRHPAAGARRRRRAGPAGHRAAGQRDHAVPDVQRRLLPRRHRAQPARRADRRRGAAHPRHGRQRDRARPSPTCCSAGSSSAGSR